MPRKLPPQPNSPISINSQMVHGLFYNDAGRTGNIHAPLYLGTTFLRTQEYEKPDERGYIRDDNPTVDQLSAMINALEGGYQALIYPSGAAAMHAVFYALSVGDCALVQDSLYFGLIHLLKDHAVRHGIKIIFIDILNHEALESALKTHKPKLLWIETPSNPMLIVSDIEKMAQLAHQNGALLAIDSTCASPVLTKPLELGADIVMHSATKYLNGHTDVLAGALITNQDSAFWQSICAARYLAGWVLSSMDCYLLIRGLKTLFLRVRAHCENAQKLAEFLSRQKHIESVLYPGLTSHPQHEIAKKQMKGGYGGLLSVLVKGNQEQALTIIKNFQMIRRATSLGGLESKAEHRFTVEGEFAVSPPNLIRFSVGLESIEDIMLDWQNALGALG